MLELYKRLLKHISTRRRWQFGILAILIVIASISEVIGLGAILPFLTVLLSPEIVYKSQILKPIFKLLNISSPNQLLLPVTFLFSCSIIISGGMRIVLLWAQTKICFALGGDFSNKAYRNVLFLPYSIHISKNSREFLSSIVKASGLVNSTILPFVNILGSFIMILMLLATLLYINIVIALSSIIGFSLIYFLIIKIFKNKLATDSLKISTESVNVLKALDEGLGGIRDILLDGTQNTYCEIYKKADSPSRTAQSNITIISGSPRFIMETLGVVLISVLAYYFIYHSSSSIQIIPILGALSLGAQRMLPLLQNLYTSWISIKGNEESLKDALEILDFDFNESTNLAINNALEFKQIIKFEKVTFNHQNSSNVILNNINLNIKKGERVGIIGETGSGKSTLLDLLMTLISPTKGYLSVDGNNICEHNRRSWQSRIAHVPQNIYLSDNSIAENIAFGIKKEMIDYDRISECIKMAKLSDTIKKLEKGVYSSVGERGTRLSGGQRQRIGIARALYKNADVIIFDEATSALDIETEEEVMNSIKSLPSNLTLVIVAHRYSTLSICDKIIELKDGKIKQIISYNELVRVM